MYITGEHIILSLSISVLAVVFSQMLITEGNIFAFYGRFLNRINEYTAKPLGLCPKCFAGQLSFWMFFFIGDYNIILHIFFIAWGILFTELLTGIYGKLFM